MTDSPETTEEHTDAAEEAAETHLDLLRAANAIASVVVNLCAGDVTKSLVALEIARRALSRGLYNHLLESDDADDVAEAADLRQRLLTGFDVSEDTCAVVSFDDHVRILPGDDLDERAAASGEDNAP